MNSTEQYRQFFQRLLAEGTATSIETASRLCRTWQVMTKSLFACLWLFNDLKGQWEVVAFSPDDFPILAPERGSGIAEFSSRIREPVMIDDIVSWSGIHQNVTFRLTYQEELLRLGCRSVLCIPLISVSQTTDNESDESTRPPIRGAMCCYFADASDSAPSVSDYDLLGKLTAWTLGVAHEAEQRKILFHMNSLAASYLTIRTRRAEDARREYLQKLIALVRHYLPVDHVSLFYRNQSGDLLECLATTGLWRANGEQLQETEIRYATYALGEGLTGHVFQTGEPVTFQVEPEVSRNVKFRDTPFTKVEHEASHLILPIRLPPNLASKSVHSHRTLGVIRCARTRLRRGHDSRKAFDSFQIQTLDFITRQVAPVLETLAANIERERTISMVKHDLYAPLRMIVDIVESLDSKSNDLDARSRDYRLQDLKFAAFSLRSLVELLDFSPTDVKALSTRPTFLEGDIVARISAMLRNYATISRDMRIQFNGIGETIPKLFVDPHLVERALSNLLINAIKYGENGSTIQVLGRRDSRGFYIDVVNQGIGIDPVDVVRVFSGNYRGASAQKSAFGMGLGLSIAKSIMQRHGGNLILTATHNPTVFTMFFPNSLAVRPPA